MIDEIIEKANSNNSYDKESYKKRKKEQLDNAYQMIDDALDELKTNQSFFLEYLKVQSKFDMYSPRNALLIAKQLPGAVQLKSKKDWIDLKASFKSPKQNRITIIEPGEPYTNKDGKKVTPIYAKDVIDISETNMKPTTRFYDKKLLLQSLFHECPITIKAVDSLDSGKKCEWNQNDKAIYICRSNNYDESIKAISTEIAKINLYENTNELDDDKANLISYMICHKYGIESSAEGINNLASKFSKMENVEIANELTSMKEVALDINTRIGQYLDNKRETRNKEQER